MASFGRDRDSVSIIIPTFNRRQLVAETIQSCLNQSHERVEVLVVDDGSTDGTAEALAAIAGGHSEDRFRYVVQSNQGVSVARNTGIELARGEYLKFMDSDDTLEPDAIEHFVAAMTDSGAELGIGGRRYMSPEGRKWSINYQPPAGLVDRPLVKFFDLDIRPQQGLWIFRRTLFDAGLRWDATLAAREDTDLIGRALVQGARVAGVPQAVLNQRYHDGVRQSSRQFEVAILESIYASNLRLHEAMRKAECPQDARDAFARSLCRTALRAYENDHRELAWKFYRLAKQACRRPQLVLLSTYPRRMRTAARLIWAVGGLAVCGPLLKLFRRAKRSSP